jgi:adenosylhomocysteine nucleosidase
MNTCIQICSKREWIATKNILQINDNVLKIYPFGEYFEFTFSNKECIFYFSGPTVTKSSSACQYAIDKWEPKLIIVLGTCGGIAPDIKDLDIIIANKTIYFNSIGSIYCENNFTYSPLTIIIDNSWINIDNIPIKIHEGIIGTNDHFNNLRAAEDLINENVLGIDWESASIAYVCSQNQVKCCIIRGVSDLPLIINDESLINEQYRKNTPIVMKILLEKILPIVLSEI